MTAQEPRKTRAASPEARDVQDAARLPSGAALADALRCRSVQRGTGRRCRLDAPHLGMRHEPGEPEADKSAPTDLDDATDEEIERQERADDEARRER